MQKSKFFVSSVVATVLLVSSGYAKNCKRDSLDFHQKEFTERVVPDSEAKVYPEYKDISTFSRICTHGFVDWFVDNHPLSPFSDKVLVYNISKWTCKDNFNADNLKIYRDDSSSEAFNTLKDTLRDDKGTEHDYCKDPHVYICVGSSVKNKHPEAEYKGIYLWTTDYAEKKDNKSGDNNGNNNQDDSDDQDDGNSETQTTTTSTPVTPVPTVTTTPEPDGDISIKSFYLVKGEKLVDTLEYHMRPGDTAYIRGEVKIRNKGDSKVEVDIDYQLEDKKDFDKKDFKVDGDKIKIKSGETGIKHTNLRVRMLEDGNVEVSTKSGKNPKVFKSEEKIYIFIDAAIDNKYDRDISSEIHSNHEYAKVIVHKQVIEAPNVSNNNHRPPFCEGKSDEECEKLTKAVFMLIMED